MMDEFIKFDITLPEKNPEYIFIEPVILSNQSPMRNLEDDLSLISQQVKRLGEQTENSQNEPEFQQREIKTELNVNQIQLNERQLEREFVFEKDKLEIEIPEFFETRTVPTDIIKPDAPRAIIDADEFTSFAKIAPPEISDRKESIIMPEIKPSIEIEEEVVTERAPSPLESLNQDNISIEIESFNKEIKEIPSLLTLAKPEYPDWAVRAGHQGFVKFRIEVSVNGTVSSITRYQSDLPSELVAYTSDYLRRWVFRPLIINDRPVESQILVTIVYRLEVKN